MKKLLLILLSLAMLFALCACSPAGDGNDDNKGGFFNNSDPVEEKDPVYNPLTGLEVEQDVQARILAVSIDNHPDARPHSGISQADIIYEIPVEGTISRLLALFYANECDNIGPVRSARPYAIDIARGWDALFVHCGGSVDAKNYLAGPEVFSIDEIVYSNYFWRDYSLHSNEHTLYTSSEKLYEYIEYREKPTVQEVEFMPFAIEGATASSSDTWADWLRIQYGTADNIYVYDEESKLYSRFISDQPFIDADNGQQIKAANIIIQYVSSRVIDNYGRLRIDMCAGGEAILFTNGHVISGNWSRDSLDSNTVYTDAQGNSFVLQPGQTWIQLVDATVDVEYRNHSLGMNDEGADNAADSSNIGDTD